ncbi:insulin-like growth factor-binding protein 3 [Molossus nigricans]
MQRTCPLLSAATLIALALLQGPPAAQAGVGSAGAGPVVRCEPCDARSLAQCAPPPATCAEVVREPGCGCCLTCALGAGQPCGVYTERCGAGLRCHPQPGEPRPLQALLEGRGLCSNTSAAGRLRTHLLPAAAAASTPPTPGNDSESEEDHSAAASRSPVLSVTHRAPDFHPGHTKIDVIKKGLTRDSQRHKVDYETQSTVTQNFSSESQQDTETEYGPCRREIEETLNHLKSLNTVSPRAIHIPNCDKRGFYKKKQCRLSKGRSRGFCWCVDKYGQPLPGFYPKGKGYVQCDSDEESK